MQWTTRDGRKLDIEKMDTDHIQNSLAMLKRNGRVSMKTLTPYLRGVPRGEGAQMLFEQEFNHVADHADPFIDAFEDELTRRQS